MKYHHNSNDYVIELLTKILKGNSVHFDDSLITEIQSAIYVLRNDATGVEGWPPEATVKLRWLDEFGTVTYAKRDSEGNLISWYNGQKFQHPVMWEIVEEKVTT